MGFTKTQITDYNCKELLIQIIVDKTLPEHQLLKNVNKLIFPVTLQSLSMTSNLVEEFPSTALRPIHELRTLHLNENKITAIGEDAFQGFGEHIKYLWLQDNM